MRNKISQKIMIATGRFTGEKEYWLNQLAGELTVSSFSPDHSGLDPAQDKNIREMVTFCFPGEVYAKLLHMSGASEYGMFIILLTGLDCLIYKYTGNDDVIVGVPIFKQKISGTYFNNILALRSRVAGEMTFKELLHQVKNNFAKANENANYPLDEIIKLLGLSIHDNYSSLFDIMIGLKNIHDGSAFNQHICGTFFSFNMTDGSIEGEINYNSTLLDFRVIESLRCHFVNCLTAVAGNPGIKLCDIEILSAGEKKQILFDFNNTAVDYPRRRRLHELFARQAVKNPDAIAVVFEDRNISYKELNEKSNRLARILKSGGVNGDEIVAIMFKRSPELVMAILAVLKAGGICFPIDPATPTNRIKSMLKDCRTSVLLTNTAAVGKHSFVHLLGLDPGEPDSRAVVTPCRPQITDFDSLPLPDRSLVQYRKYDPYIGETNIKNTYIAMQATRGCPYNCMYCHKIWPKKHVFRSAENIFREVKLYYDMGVRRFSFVDDVFNLNIKNSRRFYELVIENGLDIRFFDHNGLRGDVLTKEYIDLMIRAGAISFSLALETASPRLQKLIRKDLHIEKLRENLEYICDKYPQVILELFTMHGFPTETQEEAMMTLNFIKRLKWVHFPYVNILRIYANTDMEKLALENDFTRENNLGSEGLAYHELPDTLPFDKSFTLKYQADFLNDYFLSKERLLHVLPYQLKVFTRDEILQKYNSYFPVHLKSFDDFLAYIDITTGELGVEEYLDEDHTLVPDLDRKLKEYFPASKPDNGALRILLLDLSQLFNADKGDMLYDVVEAPLGLMYLMTYLKQQLGGKVNGKIAKSRIDFDSYEELKTLLKEFKPDLIGIRTLTFYRDFFHKAIAVIRQWGFDVPVIAGGPYATSDYGTVLQDGNIDLVVLGEGEITFTELVEKMLENGGKLPGEEVLREINGIAYIPGTKAGSKCVSRRIVMLDELEEGLQEQSPRNLAYDNRLSDYAYIVFSSGSTGRPKGTVLYHWGISNHVFTKLKELEFGPDDVLCHNLNVGFVASIWQFFAPLFTGSRLHIYPEGLLADPYEFFKRAARDCVTAAEVVPSVLGTYLELLGTGKPPIDLHSLRTLVLTGEKVSPALVNRFYKQYDISLMNAYGQSECSDDTLHYKIPCDTRTISVPVGRPSNNTHAYVLGSGRKMQPRGVAGELCISGDGLTAGYLNMPELTAEKFLPDPFVPGQRMYVTGDLGRWLPDGNIEFLGRVDHQIKIRGFRIEPEEIENRLLKINGIKKAVVVAGTMGEENFLCAYVVSKKKIAAPGLVNTLSKNVPDYMIPSFFVQLEEIPLTPSGKIDRNALPEPAITPGDEDGAVRDEVLEKLVKMWAEVLKIEEERIGVDANFFELGGNSLRSVTLVARIQKELNVDISLTDIFEIPTIKGLCQYLKEMAEGEFTGIEPSEKKEYYPLSSRQRRFYILQYMDETRVNNIAQVVFLEGSLDRGRLAQTFRKMIDRHESLRTGFDRINNEPVQRILEADEAEFHLEYSRLENHESEEEIVAGFFRPFDLSCAPLLRAGLIKKGQEGHILMVDMHHIISDGTSVQIFVKEFLALYAGEVLSPVRLQYRDFSEWQNRLSGEGKIKQQEEYWLNQFEDEIPLLNLPTDYPRPVVQRVEGESLFFEIGSIETGALRELAREEETTPFMVLLAVYNVLLSKLTGQEDIIVGTGIVGRSHADLTGIIGLFFNTLALRNYPAGEKSFKEFLRDLRDRALKSFENQDYPIDELVQKLRRRGSLPPDPNRNPLFDTMFSLHNFEVGNIEVPDVEIPGLRFLPYKHETQVSRYDLFFRTAEAGDRIMMELEYSRVIFKRTTAERIINHYEEVLDQVLENKDIPLEGIAISSQLLEAKTSRSHEEYKNFGF